MTCGDAMPGLFGDELRCVLAPGHVEAHRAVDGTQFGSLNTDSVAGLHGVDEVDDASGGGS